MQLPAAPSPCAQYPAMSNASNASNATPEATATESSAFLRAVTALGQVQPVVTSRTIVNLQGARLLEGGVQLDATLHDTLISHRLAVRIDECLVSESVVTAAVLREAAEALMERMPFFGLMGSKGRTRSMVLQVIGDIPLPAPVAFQLTLARATRPGMFEHAVQMALLCAHLVREGGAPLHEMTTAASAGLLHDMGMLCIDADLLGSGNALSGDERRPLYMHPVTSSMFVARFPAYPKEVVRAVFEHHELLDGSGYPRGLTGAAISPLGRLLSLAEVVTAMFDGARQHPLQRVSLLLRMSPARFDAALVPSIHRLLRAASGPAAGDDAAASRADSLPDSLKHLEAQSRLLSVWHDAVLASAPALSAPTRAVLAAVDEQADTLQRMLFEAGITPEQLGMLMRDAAEDPSYAVDLWVLARELHWHLGATAHQLHRRWKSAAGGQPLPDALAAWVDDVARLAEPT